jgi:hypothetical protein
MSKKCQFLQCLQCLLPTVAAIILSLDLAYYYFVKDIYIEKIEEIQKRPFQFRISGATLDWLAGLLAFTAHVVRR